jgi:hypothetical protein
LISLSFLVKGANNHIARSFVLVVFTSLFYKDSMFAFFAALLWISMIWAAVYLKIKKNSIVKGSALGIIAVLAGYYLSLFI